MIKVRFNKSPELPFKLAYLCFGTEELAGMSTSIEIGLCLKLEDYKQKMLDILTRQKRELELKDEPRPQLEIPKVSLGVYDALITLLVEAPVDSFIVMPLTSYPKGKLKYICNNHSPAMREARAKEGTIEHFVSGYYSRGGEDLESHYPANIYEGKISIIYKGEDKGSPCSSCPRVLESLKRLCVFGGSKCQDSFIPKEIWGDS